MTEFEKLGGTYRQVGDYFLPNLKIGEQDEVLIGVWGQRHRRYLKEHHRVRYIEAVYPYDDPVALICGEEAKLEGKPLNRALRDGDGDIYDIVAGKFFICGLGDENFASLPKELQQKYEEKFRQPEAFLKMGSKIMAIPTEPQKTAPKGKTAPATER